MSDMEKRLISKDVLIISMAMTMLLDEHPEMAIKDRKLLETIHESLESIEGLVAL